MNATPVEALAGQNTGLIAVGDPFVLAEHVADLAATDADVTSGHVRVFTQVAVQLSHEGLAKTHHLGIGPAVRVEIGAALAAADGQTGQGVLEDLLKSQEFDDAQIDRGMEPQTTLVGAESRVELDAETTVDLHRSSVIHPGDTEDDLTLGLADALQDLVLEVVRVLLDNGLEALEDLPDGLVELGLTGVTSNHGFEDGLQLLIHSDSSLVDFQVLTCGSLAPVCEHDVSVQKQIHAPVISRAASCPQAPSISDPRVSRSVTGTPRP